jgi:serine protease Do
VLVDDSESVAATVVGFDEGADVALLRLDRSYDGRQLEFAQGSPAVGSELAVLGYALSLGEGLGKSMQVGHVSALDAAYRIGGVTRTGMLQNDVQTNHGASGGPFLSPEGHVLGLVSIAVGEPQNVNLAAATPTVKPLVDRWSADPRDLGVCL